VTLRSHAAASPAAVSPAGGEGLSGNAPQSEAELLVAAVWAAVLGREGCGRDANFFALGGTSLAALKVANRLSQQLGTRVPVRSLFVHSDLPAFARSLEALAPELCT